MSIDKKEKTSSLLLLLFLFIIAGSIYFTNPDINKSKAPKQAEDNSEKIITSVESIEIYKLDSHKENSVIDHWYFRDAESLDIIESILDKETEKTNTAPPIKSEYRIIVSYDNKEIKAYPLWLEANSENAVLENEEFKLISKDGTKILRSLIISP